MNLCSWKNPKSKNTKVVNDFFVFCHWVFTSENLGLFSSLINESDCINN